MAVKPKVFVTRILPEAGLKLIKEACDAEIWTDQLPPPAAVLRQKIAGCDGVVSLLTDKIDTALLDAAPRLVLLDVHGTEFACAFPHPNVRYLKITTAGAGRIAMAGVTHLDLAWTGSDADPVITTLSSPCSSSA